MATIKGTSGDDNLTGTVHQGDVFRLYQGGDDTADGRGGDDFFYMRGTFTAADTLIGGSGFDTVTLRAPTFITLGANTISGIETLELKGHFFYALTTDDNNVLFGETLRVDAGHVIGPPARLPADAIPPPAGLVFDGSAETDGKFVVRASRMDDSVTGGAQADTLYMRKGGNDTVDGGGGNDVMHFGGAMDAGDTITGGGGIDTVDLNGDYGSSGSHAAFTTSDVEKYTFHAGHDYFFDVTNANVAANTLFQLDASALQTGDTAVFDGSSTTATHFLRFIGGGGTNTFTGGAEHDVFNMESASTTSASTLSGGGSADDFTFGDNFGDAITLTGGSGTDSVTINGDYSGGLALTAQNMTSVEILTCVAGHDYTITTEDGAVAAGQGLNLFGFLDAGDSLVFDGSAETDGGLFVTGGDGDDDITTGAKIDIISLDDGGNDTANGGAGNDDFMMGGKLTNADSLDGGDDSDDLVLGGDYSAGFVFDADTAVNFESIVLMAGNSYNLTLNDAMFSAFSTVNAQLLTAGNSLTLNAVAETNTFIGVSGGGGDDVIRGGQAGDFFNLGGGADTLIVGAAGESSSSEYDAIIDWDFDEDLLDLFMTVSAIASPASGTVNSGTFATDMGIVINDNLVADTAMLVTVTGGDLNGTVFLVIEGGGAGNGYDAGTDVVLNVTGFSGTLDTGDFI